jgi:hypothetical protein
VAARGTRYAIEDDFHAEILREYDDRKTADSELARLKALTAKELEVELGPTPCADRCGHRELQLIEYEAGKAP